MGVVLSQLNNSCSSSATPQDQDQSSKKKKMATSPVPRLVDNKRKQMEKSLSQSKRDQILMNSLKEDMVMKREMVESFEKSNKSLESTMKRMTDSLTVMAEGISEGMKMIAMAMTAPQQPQQSTISSFPTAGYSGGMQYQTHHPGFSLVSTRGMLIDPQRSYTPSPTPSDQHSVHSDDGSLNY